MTKKLMYICVTTFLFSILLSSFLLPAKAAEKPHFQYVVFPSNVYMNSEVTLTICMINQGGAGQLISSDYVVISIPLGDNPDDLVDSADGLSCTAHNTSWICDKTDTESEILLTFYPESIVSVLEGETICFNIDQAYINSSTGLAFLEVDQQFSSSRADQAKNSTIGIFKTDEVSSPIEIDPIFTAMDTELELESHLDVTNVYTNTDGSLTDDDLSDNVIGELLDVNTDGALDNQVLKYSAGQWVVAVDTDTDTHLTEAEVDSFVANNGYLTSYTENDPTVNTLAKTPLSCTDGQVPKWNSTTSSWECADDVDTDTDTDTQLSQAEVNAYETDPTVNTLAKTTLTCTDGQVPKWNGTTSSWECADDVDTDTDTQLSQAEVNAYETDPTVNDLGKATLTCADGQVAKWNNSTIAWECADDVDTDTDTQLSQGQVNAYETDPTVNDLGKATLTCTDGQVAKWNNTTSSWECADDVDTDTDTDTQLSQAEVNAYEADPTVNTLAKASLTCADGQVAKWNSATSVWECATDIDTDTDTQLSQAEVNAYEADPTVNALGKATLTCADGQVAKWNNAISAWECADDIDTDTHLTEAEVNAYESDPTVNALAKTPLSCADGEVAKWNNTTAAWECANDVDTDTDTDTQLSQAEVNAYETDPVMHLIILPAKPKNRIT